MESDQVYSDKSFDNRASLYPIEFKSRQSSLVEYAGNLDIRFSPNPQSQFGQQRVEGLCQLTEQYCDRKYSCHYRQTPEQTAAVAGTTCDQTR